MKASLEAQGTTVGVILDLKKKKKVISVDFNRSVMGHLQSLWNILLFLISPSMHILRPPP